MAETTGMTFVELRHALESYGLTAAEREGCIIYAHPDGSPLILFPRYQDEDVVQPIHVLMARRHLIESGLMEEPPPTLEPRITPPSRKKSSPLKPRA